MPAATVAFQKGSSQMKEEVVKLTAPSSGDTFTTLMSNPQFTFPVQQSGTEMVNCTATISGKTITVVTNAGGDDVVLKIIGF